MISKRYGCLTNTQTPTRRAAEYEHRLHIGSKAIYHLEAFVAKFMSTYKRFLMRMYV